MEQLVKSFGGVATPSFLIIENISFPVLSQADIKQMNIPMRDGAVFINRTEGIKAFTVNFAIKAASSSDVMYQADELAEWLFYKEPQPLVFRDKPNVEYMCMVDGSVDVGKFANIGRGTLTFICFDGYGLGLERTYSFSPATTEPVYIVNNGNRTTAPKMQIEFQQDVSEFSIVSDNNALIFGSTDVTKTPVNLNPKIWSDDMSSTNGWTNGFSVDRGTVTGTLSSTGQNFVQTDANFGTGSDWHGGAMIRTIGKELQDFTIEAIIGLKQTSIKQVGRVELYLLDSNNVHIGKIALIDESQLGNFSRFQARIGSNVSGKYLANTYPNNYKNAWQDFYGVIRLTRKGNKYRAYIAEIDPITRKHGGRKIIEWTDSKNLYTNLKPANVQVHVGAYYTHPTPPNLYIANVAVREHLTALEDDSEFVFEIGDILEIDNTTGEILKNGEPYYQSLYPTSSFITLDKGINGISASEPVIYGTITFRDRWL
jgi:predicted phage tail component-like protein